MSVVGRALRAALSAGLVLAAPTTLVTSLVASPPASAATTPGSVAVGTTSYAVPAGAVYAVPNNAPGGSGTASSPYQSAQTAVEKAPSGSTVVLRRGTYREYLRIPAGKRLTVQSYPGE